MLKAIDGTWLRALAAPHGSSSAGVLGRVLAFAGIAALVWLLNHNGIKVTSPVAFHEVAGAIIALTLAFRTNTAHLRFWEGRTILGALVNATRNLARLVGAHARIPEHEAKEFATWIVVFVHVTRRRLRKEDRLDEIIRLIPDDEIEAIRKADHPSLYAARKLSKQLQKIGREEKMHPMLVAQAEGLVAVLVDCLGGCERIHKTPTPFGYVLLVRRSIVFFLASLPLAIVTDAGAFVIVVTALVAYPTLMIEAIANELDDPFGHDPNDLPVSRISATIEKDLLGTELPASGAPPYVDD